MVCECTHLTTFSAALVPPIVVPEWDKLTWENIQNNPRGLIMLSSFSGFFLLQALLARRRDLTLDALGIKKTFALMEGDVLRAKELKLSTKGKSLDAFQQSYKAVLSRKFTLDNTLATPKRKKKGRARDPKRAIQTTLQQYDADSDGLLEGPELQKAFGDMGVQITDKKAVMLCPSKGSGLPIDKFCDWYVDNCDPAAGLSLKDFREWQKADDLLTYLMDPVCHVCSFLLLLLV